MPTQEEMIAAGFNAGYLMQQHEPELLEQILKSNNQDSGYLTAMIAGKDTHERQKKDEREKAKEKVIRQQKDIREKQKAKKRGR